MIDVGGAYKGQIAVFTPGNQEDDPALFIEVRDGFRAGLNPRKDQVRSANQPQRAGRLTRRPSRPRFSGRESGSALP